MDGNFVVYQGAAGTKVLFTSNTGGHTCPAGSSQCEIVFQSDGNLVVYVNGKALFNTGTQGKGNTLELNNTGLLEIYNAAGTLIYSAVATGGGGGGGPPPCGKKRDGEELDERCVAYTQ